MREEDRSVPLTALPAWVIWLSLALFAVPLLPLIIWQGADAVWRDGFGWQLLPALLLLIVVHEGVHALAWKLASGLPWSAFRFGVLWKALAPYCHATEPMRLRPYQIGAAAPLVVTGIIPLLFGYLAGSAFWVVFAAIALSAAVGDIFVLWLIRDLPTNALLRDHPEHAGCVVLLPDSPEISPE